MNKSQCDRKKEILDSLRDLYEVKPFKDISIKDISKNLTCGRTLIYHYYKTKEEIFLELFKEEFLSWNIDLLNILNTYKKLDISLYSSLMAESLIKRKTMLKILSLNISCIEEYVKLDSLIDFKKTYFETINNFKKTLYVYFINSISATKLDNIFIIFLFFLSGVYSYVSLTPKQIEAIKLSNNEIIKIDLFNVIYNSIYMLLKSEIN